MLIHFQGAIRTLVEIQPRPGGDNLRRVPPQFKRLGIQAKDETLF